MGSPFSLPRAGVPRYCNNYRRISVSGFWLLVGGAATCILSAASATTAPDPHHFQLVGSGSLNLDQPVQKGESVLLKAILTPTNAAFTASTLVQEGGRFAMTASLATESLVCYNDTIFRDSFDGTGF